MAAEIFSNVGAGMMERIDEIIRHPVFQEGLQEIKRAEKERIFCRHGMEHLLDVARIAWILNLEEGAALEKEWIYAAAFLHDIGKGRQYLDGTPHQIAGIELAREILAECHFQEAEMAVILDAIQSHRDGSVKEEKGLRGILYRADKASRACYCCEASGECNWPQTKKNLMVIY